MKRTGNLKSGLKAATVAVFLAAAVLSTGCSNNALMNPDNSSAQGVQTAHADGHPSNPSGHSNNP